MRRNCQGHIAECQENGIHVLCERTLARTMQDAEEIQRPGGVLRMFASEIVENSKSFVDIT